MEVKEAESTDTWVWPYVPGFLSLVCGSVEVHRALYRRRVNSA